MQRYLDTLGRHFYTRAALSLATVAMLGASAVQAESINGVQFPDGTEKVGENRYRLKEDFEGAKKYYKTVYPEKDYPRKQIINQPGIKAVHISNNNGRIWEGLNIYQANDETRVYVIAVEETSKPKKRGADVKGKKSR